MSRWRPFAILVAALLFHVLAWGGLERFHSSIDWNAEPFGDFTAIYYPMGRAVLEGGREPVQGFYYSPFFAFCLAPIAALPPQAAAWSWLAVEVLALAAVIVLPVRLLDVGAGRRDLYLLIALFAFPFVHDLHWGQVSTQLAALVLLALWLESRGRSGWAGVALGLAAAIKFFPLVFLLPFAAPRRWRTFQTAAATLLVALVAVPLLIWGPGGTWGFYEAVRESLAAARAGLWVAADNVQYVPAVLGRLLGGASAGDAPWGWRLLGALSFAALCGLVLMRGRRAREPFALATDVALLWLALPLVVHPSWPHYFVGLPFASLVLLARGAKIVPLVAGGLASVLLFRLLGDPRLYGHLGFLALADLLLLAALTRACVPRPPG